MSDKFVLTCLGKQGCGKSSLLNNILGKKIYQTGVTLQKDNFAQLTLNHLQDGNWSDKKDATPLETLDTPGFMDNSDGLDGKSLVNLFCRFMKEATVRGINGFVIVFNFENFEPNVDSVSIETLQMLTDMFTPNFWDHAVIVFTHCDPESNWKEKKEKVETGLIETLSAFLKDFKKPKIIYLSNLNTDGVKEIHDTVCNFKKLDNDTTKSIRKMLENSKIKDEEIDDYIIGRIVGPLGVILKECRIL
eukprot:gene3514-6161_t